MVRQWRWRGIVAIQIRSFVADDFECAATRLFDANGGRSVEETVDLRELLQEVADSMRPRAMAKSQELQTKLDDDTILQPDPERLRQVFQNLRSLLPDQQCG